LPCLKVALVQETLEDINDRLSFLNDPTNDDDLVVGYGANEDHLFVVRSTGSELASIISFRASRATWENSLISMVEDVNG